MAPAAAAAPPPAAECVRVVVRCRPLNARERADGRQAIVAVDTAARTVSLRQPPSGGAVDADGGDGSTAAGGAAPPKTFTFDAAFGADSTQREVYDNAAAAVVGSVLAGYNGTIFAYGQTGTGKTHTMEGASSDPEQRGVIPRAFEHVFEAIAAAAGARQFLVRASFLEIYNEEVRDLLSKSPKERLELKEHGKGGGVYVKGLNAFVVKSAEEIARVLEVWSLALLACFAAAVGCYLLLGAAEVRGASSLFARTKLPKTACPPHPPPQQSHTRTQVGKKNRSVGATLMNQDSSRSHSVFTVTVECVEQGAGAVSGWGKERETSEGGEDEVVSAWGSDPFTHLLKHAKRQRTKNKNIISNDRTATCASASSTSSTSPAASARPRPAPRATA